MPTASKCPPGSKWFEGHYIPSAWAPHQFYLYQFGVTKGEAKLRWFKKLVQAHWPEPKFVWDYWADLYFGACCGAKETVERVCAELGHPITIEADYAWWETVASSGAASTGKSSRTAMFLLMSWCYAQEHSLCVLTSTSMDQLKRRIWAELVEWIAKSVHKLPLDIVSSDTEVRWDKNDKKHAIFGRAVDQGGSVDNAVGRIKGLHAAHVYVAVDEATAMPEAITKACRNLDSGTKTFQLFILGNATEKEDQHGIHCEPLGGWDSVTPDAPFWLTKVGGCCIHLDGHDSPALTEPERFHFYIGRKKLEKDARFFGGTETADYWRECRGFWAPSGMSTRVMDEALLRQFHTAEKAVWGSTGFTMGGLLDPAFEGGDRRILYPCRWGAFASGVVGIEYLTPINVAVDMTQDVRWIHYSIADAVQSACEQYKIDGKPHPIKPENFIMDTTGEGGGLFSVLSGRWSPLINSFEFGGAADKTQIMPDRPTTWHELYGNRVTMLWYALRRFIEGDQVRGLTDADTIKELTSRDKMMKGGKTVVVPKREMKLGKNRSPDLADSCALGAQLLRIKGVAPAGATGAVAQMNATEWNRFADRVNVEAMDSAYADEMADFA